MIPKAVTSLDGTRICYDVHGAYSRHAVLVVPGFWRDRRHPSMQRIAAWLSGLGHCTAVLDPRGHGESGGAFGFNSHEHEDVAAVARDLLANGPVESLSLVGFSYGAATSVSTAARHALPIRSLVLISPVADFAMIAPRFNLFTLHRHIALSQALRRPRIAWNVRKHSRIRAVDDMPQVRAPVCLIHVKDDWLIGHRHSESLFEAAHDPKELHLLDVPGQYHADRIFGVAPGLIEPIVRNFLER